MGITIAGAAVMPAVVYDRIHMTRLEILQPVASDDVAHPIYHVSISYRHYGVVDGIRHYQNEDVVTVALPDFLGAALADAATGDMALLNAMQTIEVAVAAIIADQTGSITTVV